MNELKRELESLGCEFRNNTCRCPFHDDRRPSASIFYGEDGKWRFRCFTCDITYDIYDLRKRLTGKTFKEQIVSMMQPPAYKTLLEVEKTFPPIEDKYRYTNPETKQVELIVYRCIKDGNKTFRQVSQVPGGWIAKAPPKPWPILNRTRMKPATRIVVVEGEKCVKHLHNMGIIATTSPGGSLNAKNADWRPLAGKHVVLWPDNDKPGKKFVEDVRSRLELLDPSPIISVVDVDSLDLEEKQDVADLDQERIEKILADCKPEGMSSLVSAYINRATKGQLRPVYWPWPVLTKASASLVPNTVTLLCGSPGASKSLMLLQSLIYWHRQGIPCCCLMMEESTEFHIFRALAQLSGEAGITDNEWIEKNPEVAMGIFNDHRAFIDSFGQSLVSNHSMGFNHEQLLEWVEAKSYTHRIIALDPITLVNYTGNQWEAEKQLIADLQVMVKNHDCSVILVTHPTKGQGDPSLSNLYGSSSFARSVQSVLWLENHKPKFSDIILPYMTESAESKEHSRTVHIVKARNSGGMGTKIAFNFCKNSLTLSEIGTILPSK